jgi:hypothetical protein
VAACPSWSKNGLVALCFKCSSSNIFECDGFLPTEKVVRFKTKQAWSAVVQQMSYLMNPNWEKTKTERENSCSQPSSSGINILRDYVTIYNQPHHKLWKRKNRGQLCPTFVPGKYSQASTVAPSIRWRVPSTPDGKGYKRLSSWIHPHSHGRTRGH